jgi:hypothetical protein
VAHGGSETKVGFTIAHELTEQVHVFGGHQWMDYEISANAIQAGFPEISLRQSFYASGIGIGTMYTTKHDATFAMSADRILMSWDGANTERFVFGLRLNFAF